MKRPRVRFSVRWLIGAVILVGIITVIASVRRRQHLASKVAVNEVATAPETVVVQTEGRRLVEGEITVHRLRGEMQGPRRAALSRVWTYDRGGLSEVDWLERNYGKKRILNAKVPGTHYSLLIIDGAVSSVISVPHELWRIEGLEDFCNASTDLELGAKRVTLTTFGGDVREILALDFPSGLAVSYDVKYDGP